jgi:hypothetical protein
MLLDKQAGLSVLLKDTEKQNATHPRFKPGTLVVLWSNSNCEQEQMISKQPPTIFLEEPPQNV